MSIAPSLLARRLVIALAIPAIGYLLFATGQQAMESQRMARQAAELQRQVDALMVENVRLQNELTYRRRDAYAEGVAREQLGLVMPGDTAVNLVGDNIPPRSRPAPSAASSGEAEAPTDARPPAEAWLAYLFGDR
jgi:cell division protein FtsB